MNESIEFIEKKVRKHKNEIHRETESEDDIKNAEGISVKRSSPVQKCFSTFCITVFACIAFFPVFFYSSSSVRRQLFFMNYLDFQSNINYSHPATLSFSCFRNLYVQSENGITLGVWHILPNSLKSKRCSENGMDNSKEFEGDRPVILYLHGSGGNRGSSHRVAMYKVLSNSNLDSHVVTLDYRGFGDSTNSPVTVDSLVTDAGTVFNWLVKRVNASRIYIWGHSLGAAICLRLVSLRSSVHPKGIIMESPFASSVHAVRDYPLTVIYRNLPFFQWIFAEPMKGADVYFDNVALIANVSCSALILHAKDDIEVPWQQTESLYQQALQNGNTRVKCVQYDESLGYGHIHISRDSDLPNKISAFMNASAFS